MSSPNPMPIATLRLAAIAAAVGISYFLTARLGFEVAVAAEQVTTVWAPTGIALASLLLWGLRLWPAVWLAAFLANLGTSAPAWTAAVIATGNTLEPLLAVWLLRGSPDFIVTLSRVTDVVRFLRTALAASTVSATIGVSVLALASVQPWSRFPVLWFNWWFGDALGAVIVAPAIMASVRQQWTRFELVRAAQFVAASLAVSYIVFGQLLGFRAHPLEYAIFPLVIGAAASGRTAVTALVVLSASVVAIWHSAQGIGPFAGQALHDSLIPLQVFMGVLAATALLLGAAIIERRVSERRETEAAAMARQSKAAAEEGQQRLADANKELARRVLEQQTLLDVLPIGIGIATDRECREIRTNRAFAATLGLSPQSNASKTAPAGERPTNFRILTPDGQEVPDDQLPMQAAARDGRGASGLELDIVHDDGRVVRLLEYAAPLLDEHGVPQGAIGAFVDVTTVHQARATLARSEERYRQIFETAGVSLWEQDFTAARAALDELRRSGVEDLEDHLRRHPEDVDRCTALVKVVDVNQATVRLLGAADKAQLRQSLDQVLGPGTREVLAGAFVALIDGRRRFEAEAPLRTLDGRSLHAVVSVSFPVPGESLERVLVSVTDITARKQAELALRQDVEVRTTLAQVGAALAGELQTDKVIQAVTDASTGLTEAEFGAFFYNVTNENGESSPLYALSGAPREAFDRYPHPRATGIFGPTFRGESVIRLADVTKDPRYGRNPPFNGMPAGHLPVRSYLAVPVVGRGGAVLGGLFFGHSQPGRFTERHEALATGVAGWAAIALDNSRLYQEAAEANRLKDEFLATLSHELRTPLNAVLGWAHMLREGAMADTMRERALESLERNAKAQAQLVEDLLDVSRIMAGKLQIKSEPVDLGAVVAHAVDTVRAGVTAKRLTLLVHLPEERQIVVSGDADRLQQVVWNLVSNAVKFTPAGGRVEVRVQAAGPMAEIVVSDTGQGIDPAFQPHLFQRFRQMDASKTRQHGGLGLGLSIVRHLVEAHGGHVTAESAGVNQGAMFRVQLPLREAVAVEPAFSSPASAGMLAGIRALIVDDEADSRELSRYVLESRGAVAVAAASAGEALHMLSTESYDVLIADIGMPEQDGLALIRAVRGLPPHSPNREIPAIALTAYTGVRERDEALAAGFDLHVGKPVEPEQLVAAVATRGRGREQADTGR